METKDCNNTPELSRRHFLKSSAGIALAGLGATMVSGNAQAGHRWDNNNNHHSDKNFWKKVEKEFTLDKKTTYMNIGTTGSMPESVLQSYNKNNQIVASNPWDMQDKFGGWPYVSEMVAKIAPGFGAQTNEIILSRNTTDGMCTILNGLHFEAGDVILTTHHEHVAGNSPFHVVSERYGVEVVYLDIPVYTPDNEISAQDFVDVFADAVEKYGASVRLISFSHITYKTGTTLPAKRICQEVAIPNSIPTLIDGAHTIGMLNLDFNDMDCDFYVGSGHKWQCGPGATGILYVRDNATRLDNYWADRENPLWFINSSLGHASYLGTQLQLQYVGNDNYPAKQALCDACNLWDEIGRDKIEARVLHLSQLCKTLLQAAFPTAQLYAPNVPELSSGLTTFNPFSDQTDLVILTELRDRLREETGFIIRTTDFKLFSNDATDVHALRISTHLFHSEQDVVELVDALQQVFQTM
ncbi:aminotransferase [Psychromonas marina]|uniref:Aminotransferase n=1 Tax=Psychromonas marina TaxID=88364 RepID=A0ABQ6E125_9GAMM|nr:aminotransferase class V-fold PLP-dependent enzyme [Psychromonas marina]GLS90905.1 aminotransferase [Psychromonas marina]